MHSQTFLKRRAVSERTTFSRSTIYRLIAEGKFPPPVKLADRAVAWRLADIEAWEQSRPSTARTAA